MHVAQELGPLDHRRPRAVLPFADIAKQTDVPVTTIDSPFGKITYLPSLIELPEIKPAYVRGPQPLGSSLLEWEN